MVDRKQRENYEGPTWPREKLLGELDRRGIWFSETMSDQRLREALMLCDVENVPEVGGRGPWIPTFGGHRFYPLAPEAEDIDLRDIAHSLALTCRFNGHLPQPYSVAQHSLLLRTVLPREFSSWALLHDAGEAYFGDLVRPLKEHWELFSEAEDRFLRVLAGKFDLAWPMPKEVERADFAAAVAEGKYFGMDVSEWSVPDDFDSAMMDKIVHVLGCSGGVNDLLSWSWRETEIVFLRQLSLV